MDSYNKTWTFSRLSEAHSSLKSVETMLRRDDGCGEMADKLARLAAQLQNRMNEVRGMFKLSACGVACN